MKKILVIEDDLSIQQVMIDILENDGYKVFAGGNGKAGLDLALEIKPDLIICDIMMPVMDGYAVISSLLNNPHTSAIPFIFLSAKTEKDSVRHGMELGADDYLTKPFRVNELLKAVEIRLRKRELIESQHKESAYNREDETKVSESDHIIIKQENGPKLVKVNSICCITAFADYTYVFTDDGKKMIVRRLLKEWEEILPEKIFLRIHRSTIVNINSIDKIETWYNNSLAVCIHNIDEKFIISRRHASRLKTQFHFK
jgi:DNA-binding LytR/AlgR family response regulator